jgi:hypothetical protein
MIRIIVLLIALLVSSTGAARADFETYQSWVDLPEGQRIAYIQGVFDYSGRLRRHGDFLARRG